MTDKPIYLVQVPNTFSPQKIAEIWENIEKKVKDKTVIVSQYEGKEIKHTVLGDSFNKELYQAKRFFDTLNNIIFYDDSINKGCIARGGNKDIANKYGYEFDTFENAAIEVVLKCFELELKEIEYRKTIQQLEHKIKMLSL